MKRLMTLFLLLVPAILFAQSGDAWFEETMYSSGKIYVVVAVAVVILLGVFAYLIWMDRRLRKLEEEQSETD